MDEITVETIEVLNTDRTLLLDSALQADYTNLPYPLDFVDPGLQASAQHHGIPTFFLDWTRGAIKASHFAILGWDEKTNSNIVIVEKKVEKTLGGHL